MSSRGLVLALSLLTQAASGTNADERNEGTVLSVFSEREFRYVIGVACMSTYPADSRSFEEFWRFVEAPGRGMYRGWYECRDYAGYVNVEAGALEPGRDVIAVCNPFEDAQPCLFTLLRLEAPALELPP